MPNNFYILLALAWAFAIALMAVIWWLSVRIRNAGIVDIAWAGGFAPIAIFYAAVGNGWPARRWLMAGMAGLWSARLCVHLYVRVMGHHPVEDRRYAQLRAEWKANVNGKMFQFFQLQAVLLAVLSAPFLFVCRNVKPEFSALEIAGVVVWLVALAGESLADFQLKQFKADPANQGRVCEAGLWRYSRHPNYFFEWLIWMAFFAMAAATPWGWVTVYGPALMLFFLLRVTGIPMTEELAVKTKGEPYRTYQKTTSAFVPWFRRQTQ